MDAKKRVSRLAAGTSVLMSSIPDHWFVWSLRATGFGNGLPGARSAWLAVFQEEPEETRTQRNGVEQCRGPLARGWLRQLGREHRRVDLVQQAVLPPQADYGAFVTLQSFRTVLEPFTRYAEALFKACNPVSRVALGGILKARTSTVSESVGLLRKWLPALQIDDAAEDLVYRINRPTLSDEMRMNRLGTWSAVLEQRVEISGDGVHQGPPAPTVVLEIDINTDANRNEPIPQEKLAKVLEVMTREFSSVALNGDRL
jgi:hypothetical protein